MIVANKHSLTLWKMTRVHMNAFTSLEKFGSHELHC